MHLTAFTLLSALLIPTALATVQTACYNYFLEKDGCVFSAADSQTRCSADSKSADGAVPQFTLQDGFSRKKRGLYDTLARRYDTSTSVFPILGGHGICGTYDTNQEDGACLWSGTSSSGADPTTAGWLNGAMTSNCKKRLYIQRAGNPSGAVFVPVIDGCSFNTNDVKVGCFQLALTNKTFYSLNPSEAEIGMQAIYDITWDFDNLHGTDPSQGPV